jgi:hypothetical protein
MIQFKIKSQTGMGGTGRKPAEAQSSDNTSGAPEAVCFGHHGGFHKNYGF